MKTPGENTPQDAAILSIVINEVSLDMLQLIKSAAAARNVTTQEQYELGQVNAQKFIDIVQDNPDKRANGLNTLTALAIAFISAVRAMNPNLPVFGGANNVGADDVENGIDNVTKQMQMMSDATKNVFEKP